jgi:putative copper export protein
LAWFSLAVLAVTGLFQMSANPNYEGFFSIKNTWAGAILVKHILFLGMILLATYQTWWLMPALQRSLMIRQSLSQGDPRIDRLQTQENRVAGISLVLGVVVLLLTALARAS